MENFGNALKLGYMADQGEINEGHAYAYMALVAIKAGVDTYGLVPPGSSDPRALVASLLIGDVITGYGYLLGISDDPGVIGSILISIFGEACINRGAVANSFSTPNYVSNQYMGENIHVSSRIHRPRGGDYIPEDFAYTFNNQEVYKTDDSQIEGAFSFTIPSNLLNPKELNKLTQHNSHRNKGNYIIQRNVNVYIPVTNDLPIDIPGDSKEDAENGLEKYNEIKPLQPDFAVFAEDIKVKQQPVVQGQQTELTVKIHNIGTLGGFASFKVYDNDTVLLSKSVRIKDFSSKEFTMNWNPKTTGKHNLKVVIEQGLEGFESSVDNNTVTKAYDVLPQDSEGPEITNVFPAEDGSDYSIVSADIKDAVGIKSIELYVDGVKKTVKSSEKRMWHNLDKKLSIGEHTFKIVATDQLGNQSEKEWTVSITENPELQIEKLEFLVSNDLSLLPNHSIHLPDILDITLKNGNRGLFEEFKDEIEFTISDSTVAKIDNGLFLEGLKAGEVTVTAQSGEIKDSMKVKIVDPITYSMTIPKLSGITSPRVTVYGFRENDSWIDYSYLDSVSQPANEDGEKYVYGPKIDPAAKERYDI